MSKPKGNDEFLYKFGDRVVSRPIGKKPEFVGAVTFLFRSGKGDLLYHVRDDEGNYWTRGHGDLTAPEPDCSIEEVSGKCRALPGS